jgi:hypothetical protein
MATYMDNDRPLLLDNILFENLIKNNKSMHFDDVKLKRLSSILSNIPYNMLKQSYDHYQRNNKINEQFITITTAKNEQQNDSRSHNNDATTIKENNTTETYNEKAKKEREQSPIRLMYDKANQIVIHVCDEAKQLKRDFTCPRDLLIKEMKYFSHNINLGTTNSSVSTSNANSSSHTPSSIAKRTLDDMDISVHCDINIFDWLMRYVKRYVIDDPENDTPNEPKLEITNCVSILISSDFLIMPDLVDKCVKFMIENMNQILQIPCNMNTINDKLISKIASFIKIQPLDDLIDKKDKFKAKLFMKKIEFLFDIVKFKQQFDNNEDLLAELGNYYHYDINENDCATLFRCKICGRIMTQRESKYIKCKLGVLDKHGNYNYFHLNDDKFDINNFITELKERLKTWQHVYWYLWALIKCSKCQLCKEWFLFVEFNKCLATSTDCHLHGKSVNGSTQKRTTCTCVYKDHIFDQSSFQTFYNCNNLTASIILQLNKHLVDDLIKHKDIICYGNGLVSLQNVNNTDGSVSFSNLIENHFSKLNGDTNQQQQQQQPVSSNFFLDSITGKHISFFNKHYLNLISLSNGQNSINDASSINLLTSDITLYLRLMQNLDPLNVFNSQDVLAFLKADLKKKWDQAKPARWNQDNQREDDMRRFREICNYIFKIRFAQDQAMINLTSKARGQNNRGGNNNSNTANVLTNVSSVEPPASGSYFRIENDWKARISNNVQNYGSATSTNTNISSANVSSSLSYTNQNVLSSVTSNQNVAAGSNVNNFSSFLNSKNINNGSNYGNNNNINNKLRQGAVATISKFSNN